MSPQSPRNRAVGAAVGPVVDRVIARPGTAALVLIVLTTLARLLGSAGLVDPLAGPDTGSYVAAADWLSTHGLLAHHAPNLPYWPAGYPTFLAVIFDVVGHTPRVVAAIQVLLLGGATWSLFAFTRRELGAGPAFIAVVLACASPALFAASNELMYETVLASALVVSLDLLSRATRRGGTTGLIQAGGGALLLGLASTMQPKALVVLPVLIVWVAVRRRDPRMVAVVLIAGIVGPLALAARTDATAGRWALSANLGATARIGLNDHAGGGYRYDVGVLHGCDLPPRLVSRDRVGFSDSDLFTFDGKLTHCSLRWAADHPLHAAGLAATKALYFWSPMVGPLVPDRDATWAQPFDYRRATPASVQHSGAFATVNRVLGNLWTLVVVGLVVAGLIVGWRSRRAAMLVVAAPVLLFTALSMLTIGDARFRLPITPLYIILQAVALWALALRVGAGRRAGRG